MPFVRQPMILLVSEDPALLSAIEPVLRSTGVEVRIAMSSEHAMDICQEVAAPALLLLDGMLHDVQASRVLANVRETERGPHIAIVLLADTVEDEWHGRLMEGVLDDLIPRSRGNAHWRVRLEMVLRTYHRIGGVESVAGVAAGVRADGRADRCVQPDDVGDDAIS